MLGETTNPAMTPGSDYRVLVAIVTALFTSKGESSGYCHLGRESTAELWVN